VDFSREAKVAISLKLEALVDLVAAEPSAEAVVCSGNYQARAVCKEMLTTVGLEASNGRCRDNCAAQSLFYIP